jgi:mannose-6-phosphate isomerase-like protein (cupin superfamily)
MTSQTETPKSDTPAIGSTGNLVEVMHGEQLLVRIPASQTNGDYSVSELAIAPRFGLPLHIHRNEDEHFLILEGSARFVCGERIFDASSGSTVTIPRGVKHTWVNLSEASPLRMLVMFTPGGFERCLQEVAGAEKSRAEAIVNSYGTSVVDPPIVI